MAVVSTVSRYFDISRYFLSPRVFVSAAIALIAFTAAATSGAAAEDRAALVIGNSAYQHTPKLENPGNDAADVANSLRNLGFKVIEAHDLDKAGMDRAIREFSDALSSSKVGLFYYAGHGLQVGGQNYLVPVDAALSTASALDFEMVRLDLVHRTMESSSGTNIIILDACRDNPLSRNLARALGTRSSGIGRGLAAVESGEGTLISFSTQPGSVALDGTGRNSPYAAALVKHIANPGDDLSSVLINVRNDVMDATSKRQVPWEHSALTARFYFVPPAEPATIAGGAAAATAGSAQTYEQQAELAFWTAVKDSGNPLIIKTYLDRFPNGTFAGLARAMTDKILEEGAAKAKAQQEVDLAKAEAARQAAEALSDATLNQDTAKQAEALLKAKDDAAKQAEQDLIAAEKAALAARDAADKAKSERDAAATGGTVAIASLAAAGSATPPSQPSTVASDPATLTKRLQMELKRVGCDPGDIDGNWGAQGREALGNFAESAKLALPVDEPTEAAYEAVVANKDQVCDDSDSERAGNSRASSSGATKPRYTAKPQYKSRSTVSNGARDTDNDEPRVKKKWASKSNDDDDDDDKSKKSYGGSGYKSKSTSHSSRSWSSKGQNRSYSSRSTGRSKSYSNADAAVGALILGAAVGFAISKSKRGHSRGGDSGGDD
jgi:Caspase domain